MESAATLGLTVEEKEGYFRIPYGLLDKGFGKFSLAGLFSAAKILTFSCVKKQPTARCRSKISEFANDLHITERHTSRTIKRLIDEGLIEKVTDEKGEVIRSWYNYIGAHGFDEGFIRIDMANLYTEFEFKPEKGQTEKYKRYLTLAEVLVLSYMVTHCDNVKRKKNKFEGSYRSIAKKLKLAVSTVSSAIHFLMKAKLVFRPKECQNGSGWSTYFVNETLLLRTKEAESKKREAQEAKKAAEQGTVEEQKHSIVRTVVHVNPAIEAANAKAKREQYYAKLQREAQRPAEQAKARLEIDPEYRSATQGIACLQAPIAKADIYGRYAEMRRLKKEEKALKQKRLDRMQLMGICEEDLQPRYRCLRCQDTGFLPKGVGCTCYPGETSTGRNLEE